jgi:hypothetical protein
LLGLRATGEGCFNIHDFNDERKGATMYNLRPETP